MHLSAESEADLRARLAEAEARAEALETAYVEAKAATAEARRSFFDYVSRDARLSSRLAELDAALKTEADGVRRNSVNVLLGYVRLHIAAHRCFRALRRSERGD